MRVGFGLLRVSIGLLGLRLRLGRAWLSLPRIGRRLLRTWQRIPLFRSRSRFGGGDVIGVHLARRGRQPSGLVPFGGGESAQLFEAEHLGGIGAIGFDHRPQPLKFCGSQRLGGAIGGRGLILADEQLGCDRLGRLLGRLPTPGARRVVRHRWNAHGVIFA